MTVICLFNVVPTRSILAYMEHIDVKIEFLGVLIDGTSVFQACACEIKHTPHKKIRVSPFTIRSDYALTRSPGESVRRLGFPLMPIDGVVIGKG
ncbi:hypothetical protein L1987_68745 [Smallanthus sonchifolius]|uniref:Uncharacterized protein n=1 Tax=Smallanthus sonchifolius TaxID=185202 RepID=A0ACB9B976_9ASTR|nr:hypothetical protein L1987_68745 [Smallanthus sonchifolius]